MNKRYVKNNKSYKKPSEYNEEKIAAAMKRLKAKRKVPTSVALDPDLVDAIKKAAEERGVPYQVLLRMFIIEGFKSWQKSA
ncbi:MAG: CopG antitoxin of type toxin-antitoxin system [Pseudomonadota bacterium]|jgi:predicted DNA binding CopG/RHH family protein